LERKVTTIAVIPARFASTRFPGKPLAKETGKFMIQHVYERVAAASRIDRVIVATDDERIITAVKSFGGEARMTRSDHFSGTDRVAEVAEAVGLTDDDIVLNVQGDEPEIEPDSLDKLVERMNGCRASSPSPQPSPLKGEGVGGAAFEHGTPTCSIGTIAAPFDDAGPREGTGSPLDPNCVKVVVDGQGRAMYFSRSPIPFPRDTKGAVDKPSRWLLHMGVYAFCAGTLREIAGGRLSPSKLEKAESLEQLRWLEAGYSIAVAVVEHRSVGIDTPEDYAAFVERCRQKKSGVTFGPGRTWVAAGKPAEQ
jgi:3-deoxy-manno-octulosonate cytidylyltransferase (CMP-KDO synthetase)